MYIVACRQAWVGCWWPGWNADWGIFLGEVLPRTSRRRNTCDHLSKVFLVSASHYNAGMSSCQISWGNRIMFCKWPVYQVNHALVVDIQNPSPDGILRNTDLVSFIHRRGGRVGVDEYGVVGAREVMTLDELRMTSNQWQPRSSSIATTLFQVCSPLCR